MKDLEKLHGKRFTAEIGGVHVEGRICYGGYSSKRYIFLCQNTKDGLRPDGNDMLGYKYGWMLEDFNNLERNNITNLKIIELMTKEEIENYKDFTEGDLLHNEAHKCIKKVDAVLNNIVFTIDQDEYQTVTVRSKTELYNKGWRLHVEPEASPIVEMTLEEIAKLKGINVEQLRIKE